MSLDAVKKFLEENKTCVLATVASDGRPQAATVGFSVDDSFNLLVGTNRNSRKYQNLVNNKKVALVVGFSGDKTVQIEGMVTNDIPLSDERVAQHYEKVPGAKRFKDYEGQTYLMIVPSWLRMTDYSSVEPIYETRQFK
jgi:uncharacterized pyridoxamine 5'-phosphate oxidase family protein